MQPRIAARPGWIREARVASAGSETLIGNGCSQAITGAGWDGAWLPACVRVVERDSKRPLTRIHCGVDWLQHHLIAVIGTVAVFVVGSLVLGIGQKIINARVRNPREHYRDRKLLSTLVTVIGAILIAILWARLIPHHGTFFGLLAAGLAVALREPLLSIAGRIAIFAGRIYEVGDRVQIGSSSGDVIDVGFIYTRIMEIGNWISGDQYSGRILQFPNAQIFGAGVFNYTRDFQYIWDEIQLNITYQSNLEAASHILTHAAGEYTREFLQGAQEQLKRMQQYFLVQDFELKPQVYIKVTTNWVGLTLRYVVDPRKRRAASTFLYRSVFEQIMQRQDIEIGTDTMEITYKRANSASEAPQRERAA
jgi:small-conductance mechanosensitive channel